MLMIRPRGRLLLCVVLLAGSTCGFLGLLQSELLSWEPPSQPSPERVAAPKPAGSKPLRIKQDPKDGSPRAIQAGIVHVYEFNLKPGEYVHFVVDQQGVDAVVEAFDQNGRFLFDVDSKNGSEGPEDVPLLAGAKSSFRVEVSTKGKGTYRTRIARRRPAIEEDRAWLGGAVAYSEAQHLSDSLLKEREAKYRLAADLWRKAGHSGGEADALDKLGGLHRRSGERKKAAECYVQALPLYRNVGNRPQEAAVLNDLGLTYSDLGQTGLGEIYCQQALALARESGDLKVAVAALTNLCKIALRRSAFTEAFASCEEALQLGKKIGSAKGEVEVLNLLGRLHLELGQADKALELHNTALDIASRKGLAGERAVTWTHIGDAYLNLDRLEFAIRFYKMALQAQRNFEDLQNEAITLTNLSLAYYYAKNSKESRDALQRAISLFEQQRLVTQQGMAMANLGWVLDQLGQYPQAMDAHARALKLAQDTGNRTAESACLYGMAWTERHRGNLLAAQARAQEAIEVVESQLSSIEQKEGRSSFFALRQNFYDFMVEILLQRHRLQPSRGYDLQALEMSERARGRSLRETLSGSFDPPALSIREIQQRVLDEDTVLLEIFLGDPQSYLWVVTSSEVSSYPLPGRDVIEPLAREVYALLGRSHQREDRPAAEDKARRLSRSLFGPVAGRLRGKRLLIVAPPPLQYIPFAVLPDPSLPAAPASPDHLWPRSLIDRYEIVTAPSASAIAAIRGRHSGPQARSGSLAALADPVISRRDPRLRGLDLQVAGADSAADALKRLEYADDEAEAIVKLFPPENIFKAVGFDATRELAMSGRLGSYEILHFATHGLPNQQDARLSALVLSRFDRQGRPLYGFLHAKDIETLDLSADLVVLSACGTALGKEIRGEGFVGLPQAFLSAGASRVIVSVWDVDDRATADLMTRFYEHLRTENSLSSEALREAQIFLKKRPGRSAPKYWAGFVLQGDWQSSF